MNTWFSSSVTQFTCGVVAGVGVFVLVSRGLRLFSDNSSCEFQEERDRTVNLATDAGIENEVLLHNPVLLHGGNSVTAQLGQLTAGISGSANAEGERNENLVGLLFHIAKDQAYREGFIHRGITCNSCSASPICGTRFRCVNCTDYDVCEVCEPGDNHNRTHVFLKVKYPIPPLANPKTSCLKTFYTGNDLQLNYEVVAGLLACDFLGANLFARNGTLARKYNFAEFFGKFHSQSHQAVLASKLRCVLQYFRRLSTGDNTWCSSRMVTFSPKEVHDYNTLPSLDTWLSNQSPLCSVKVDYKSDVTAADGNTMEFNFVRHLSEDSHSDSEDCEQDDHNVFQYPELLVAGWVFQHVHSDEAMIVKKDEWNNFHVATTGVSIQSRDIHDYRRIFCNQLNRTWIGLSGNSSTTIDKETYTTNENQENNVSVIQNNASFLPKEAIQSPVDTSSQNSSTASDESPICENGVNNKETALQSYSELLSQFLIRKATQDVSTRRRLPDESKCSIHKENAQSPCDQIDQRNEHVPPVESKAGNKRSHCTPFKSISTTCSTLNYTYADLLLESLTLSVHRAVSLTSAISNLVKQPTCILLQDGNGLRNNFGIDKLKMITSKLNGSVLYDPKSVFHKCPSVKLNSLPRQVNGCSATIFYGTCSCLETMASNLAQSITQSAIKLASQILSPEHSNSRTLSDCGDKKQLSTYSPSLSTGTNTTTTLSEEITNGKSRNRSSTKHFSEISKNSAFKMNDSIVSNDPKCGNHSLDVSEQARKSSLRQQCDLDIFAETMSNKILSSVTERARTTLLNDDEDKKQPLPSHNLSRCVPNEDIQLQIAIQWIVASTMGCPCLICYTNEEIKSNNMAWISDRAHKNGWLVSDIVECILEYYQTKLNNHIHDQSRLFDVLQSKIKDPKH